jgi:hypothetical protein
VKSPTENPGTHPHVTIWETLSAEGLQFTIGTYRTLLHRSRKKKQCSKQKAEPLPRSNQQSMPLHTQPSLPKNNTVGEPETFDWNKLKNETPSW